jgi:hypothetical protein
MVKRKGIGIGELPQYAIVFVVGFVVVAFGAGIISSIGTGLSGNAALVAGNATAGMSTLGSYAPTVATVVAGALVIGILVSAFMHKSV